MTLLGAGVANIFIRVLGDPYLRRKIIKLICKRRESKKSKNTLKKGTNDHTMITSYESASDLGRSSTFTRRPIGIRRYTDKVTGSPDNQVPVVVLN